MVVTLAERQATQRSRQLELLAVELLRSLKSSCQTAHALGRRQLTWGAVVPGVQAGQEEDMDDVLAMLDQKMTEDQKLGPSFKKIEWCKAQAPTEWVPQPARFGSHMQVRVHWSDGDGIYFE
ncbi:unnamed protein product [Cladocopium goreaui]|uniref:Ubiquitin-conjugating enzyme E2 27 n=1 Tax=Cladocopium goreaui TaxID=2562237 RepID=A0A9P1CNZ2_9DINO|nr:unnamed protein product [Cladocopium goreaui]|mmetsp:Transcript_67006/g.146895  ORF Transcript_67006/g.146895 Transcript_67006/m.146895 type:complete len:122 (-) Transcript_67006:84-449(-)